MSEAQTAEKSETEKAPESYRKSAAPEKKKNIIELSNVTQTYVRGKEPLTVLDGLTLNIDGQLWTVVDFQHVKPGKGGAFVRTKLKNVLSGGRIAGDIFKQFLAVDIPAEHAGHAPAEAAAARAGLSANGNRQRGGDRRGRRRIAAETVPRRLTLLLWKW